MTDNIRWGLDNPHPFSQMKTELIWEGKCDEYDNRQPRFFLDPLSYLSIYWLKKVIVIIFSTKYSHAEYISNKICPKADRGYLQSAAILGLDKPRVSREGGEAFFLFF